MTTRAGTVFNNYFNFVALLYFPRSTRRKVWWIMRYLVGRGYPLYSSLWRASFLWKHGPWNLRFRQERSIHI